MGKAAAYLPSGERVPHRAQLPARGVSLHNGGRSTTCGGGLTLTSLIYSENSADLQRPVNSLSVQLADSQQPTERISRICQLPANDMDFADRRSVICSHWPIFSNSRTDVPLFAAYKHILLLK